MNNSFKYYLLAFLHYFDFKGKATRSEFWFFNLYNLLIEIIFIILFFVGLLNPYILLIYGIFVFIPKSSIIIRRLRDAAFNIYISLPYIITNLMLITIGLPGNRELYLLFRSFYWVYFITLIVLLCFPSKKKRSKNTIPKHKKYSK